MIELDGALMEEGSAALIVHEDGGYELILPKDEDAVTKHVMQVIIKLLRHEELVEYVMKWEESGDFQLGDAEEVWH